MPSHYNKRTGQDYLDAEHKRRHKEYSEAELKKRLKKQEERFQKAVLRGPAAKMEAIGTVPHGKKAKLTPLKKKKKLPLKNNVTIYQAHPSHLY